MMYTIYMLPREHANSFMNYTWAKRHGGVNKAEYERVCTGYIDPRENESVQDVLELIYRKHNADDRPHSHRMRSLSVSDLVELEGSGTWFCDSFGFKKID